MLKDTMSKTVRHKDIQAESATMNSIQCNILAAMSTITTYSQIVKRHYLARGFQAMGVMMDNTARTRIGVEAEAAKYLNIVDTTLTEVEDNIQMGNRTFIKGPWFIKIALAHQQAITPTCKE